MKKILVQPEFKMLRVALFAVLFMVIPTIVQNSWNSYQTNYYQTSDISNFYEPGEIFADNICEGDITQLLQSTRFVYGTEVGWAADIVRELHKVNDNGTNPKVYEESAEVFIEIKDFGESARIAAIPVMPVGLYRWEVNIKTLYLPYGVERNDAPSLISNVFAIETCL